MILDKSYNGYYFNVKALIAFSIILFLFGSTFAQSNSSATEKNLKSDMQKYLVSLNTADTEGLRTYLYPDMFRNLREEYPNDFNDSLMDEFLKSFTDLFSEAKKAGVKIQTRVGEIQKISQEKEKQIFLIKVLIDMERGNYKSTTGSYVLGISLDRGENFTFLAYDKDETSPVLKYRFSSDTIKKVNTAVSNSM